MLMIPKIQSREQSPNEYQLKGIVHVQRSRCNQPDTMAFWLTRYVTTPASPVGMVISRAHHCIISITFSVPISLPAQPTSSPGEFTIDKARGGAQRRPSERDYGLFLVVAAYRRDRCTVFVQSQHVITAPTGQDSGEAVIALVAGILVDGIVDASHW